MVSSDHKELKLIDKASVEFSRKELHQIRERNGTDVFCPAYNAVVEKAWELDYFHVFLPDTVGGSGPDLTALCTILKNLCLEDSSLAAIILAGLTSFEILLASGKEDLLKRFTMNGNQSSDFLIGFPLFSQPDESGNNDLIATLEAGNHLLSGSVDYLVLGGLAKKGLVPARLEGEEGFVFFLIDLTEAGVTLGEQVEGLGISACPVCDVRLNSVPALPCCLAGEGRAIYDRVSAKMSLALSAMQTGIMKGSFRDAMDYTGMREQGGRKTSNWSEIKKILSEMAIKVQLAELLVSQCCISTKKSSEHWQASSIATSISISEMANRVTSDGIQVMGGAGYMRDFHQEKRFRDSRHLMSAFGMQQWKKLNFLEQFVPKSVK